MLRSSLVAIAVTLMTLPGQGFASDCFRGVDPGALPDKDIALEAMTHGEAGRAMAEAVFAGDTSAVAQLAAEDPGLLDTHVPKVEYPDFAPDGQFGDLLTFAVARCDVEMIDALLDAGLSADGHHVGEALALSVRANTPDLMEHLLEAGADPNPQIRNPYGDAMAVAYRARNSAAVRLLIEAGADLDWADASGRTHLHGAAAGNAMEAAEIMIEAGADPWRVARGGSMPVQGIARPLMLHTDADEAARQRLVERLSGTERGWPPSDPVETRRLIIAGEWPWDIDPDIAAHTRESFAPDGQPLR